MARICLINPRFPTSFWGLNHGLPLLGKKANMPVLALPVLAGLTPAEHEVVLIDENVQEIDFDALEGFDIVGLTGMTVQRDRMRDILLELQARDIFVVIGGPWITVAEDWFRGLVDVMFVGEAEETWPKFLEDWSRNEWKPRYEQAEKTDMTKVPLPRYDLVPFREYAMGCIQTSRGCPFQCEFCDIIVIFGRKPRVKTAELVVAEIDAQHKLGVHVIFLVDDNFIGNKKAAKVILRAIVEWQKQHGYPLAFFTEASLDLAEDDELMQLMADAGMVAVFIGVESPDEDALRETKKYQNVRGGLIERVHKVQAAGLEVYAGMIVGFDSDDTGIFERQFEFLQRARVIGAMAGMLSAIPKTPLYDRLEAAGRLDNAAADDPRIATNVIPLLMSREEMRDGWLDLMDRLYDAENYFERFDELFIKGKLPLASAKMRWLRRHKPLAYLKNQTLTILGALGMLFRLWTDPRTKPYRPVYAKYLRKMILSGRPPRYLFQFAWKCILHTHFATMTRQMVRGESRLVNT
ncbi:B12-binding domain-containing radical SAM protein [Singulisphaera acidiphila]|uniref:Fe-S oxidoreductase n=1 Tax=Singulisphaera acidiphila (strain ATCC BAA-1392 / DSM 18658 / VKM B-2454 / MOB10) TaxID=886293 RepID=L0DB33_SINAD|nr:B12-binding domain-containing radical SAM protein [Singulisphaera acidiphila]AGA26070.1 Fe-S oxidoreductase [Singulisphaera acidiphila DSM 18658]